MKKLSVLVLAVVCMGIISCRDSKKEQEEAEIIIEKIETLEKNLDETNEELNNKAKEAEDALNELDI